MDYTKYLLKMTCLQSLKEQIESMPLHNHVDVLRILKQHDTVSLNENKNGTFVNMSELSDEVVDALNQYVSYVMMQQKDLVNVEHAKEQLEQQYFLTALTNEKIKSKSVANTPLFKNVQKQDKSKKTAP